MKIAVAGTGYVGLSMATLLAQYHSVVAMQIFIEKDYWISRSRWLTFSFFFVFSVFKLTGEMFSSPYFGVTLSGFL